MRRLKLAIIFAVAAFGGINPAFATDSDITTGVQSLPASASLSTTTQPTFVSYRITLSPYTATSNETFNPVYFTATTTVVGSDSDDSVGDQTAAFVSPPAGCVLSGSTTINCTFSPGLSSAGIGGSPSASLPKIFTVVVQVPTAGGRIKFVSETRWFELVGHGDCGVAPSFPLPVVPIGSACYETEGAKTIYTTLNPADPQVVDTYLPAPGTVTTGETQGVLTCNDRNTDPNRWINIVKVPAEAQVGVNLKPFTDTTPPAGTMLFSTLAIPGQVFGDGIRWWFHDAASKLLVITQKRHRCTIGSGQGTLKDGLIGLAQRPYYKPDHPVFWPGTTIPKNPPQGQTEPVFQHVPFCLVSGGPYLGDPCLLLEYYDSGRNLIRVFFANENGKYAQ
jgi:hypothetical protein